MRGRRRRQAARGRTRGRHAVAQGHRQVKHEAAEEAAVNLAGDLQQHPGVVMRMQAVCALAARMLAEVARR